MTDQFAYINKTYGLTLKRGSRVEYTGDRGGPKRGAVTSAAGQYINVRFDGTTASVGPFHPTWEMRQIEAEPSHVQPRTRTLPHSQGDNEWLSLIGQMRTPSE